MRTRAVFALLLGLGLAACAGASTSGDDTTQSQDELRHAKTSCDGGACIPTNGSCGLSSKQPTGTCCDPAARCIEYTVYDYARCRIPYPKGQFCYRNEQCASGVCGSGSSCQ